MGGGGCTYDNHYLLFGSCSFLKQELNPWGGSSAGSCHCPGGQALGGGPQCYLHPLKCRFAALGERHWQDEAVPCLPPPSPTTGPISSPSPPASVDGARGCPITTTRDWPRELQWPVEESACLRRKPGPCCPQGIPSPSAGAPPGMGGADMTQPWLWGEGLSPQVPSFPFFSFLSFRKS